MNVIRVAAAQFAVRTDLADNLATVLRMIDEAAAHRPKVLVLPEFCNHLSVYDSAEHAWAVAVDLDGQWVTQVARRAAQHSCWIQLNCTVRRQPQRITNTNLIFSPAGDLVAANDKTVLMGAEGIFLSPADEPSTLVVTDFTTIGTYACMDGVIPEVPRSVVVRGARLLLNSLNSFALDEALLHVPVRAAENRAWVVACCKVGPLLPADKVAEFSIAMGVPGEMLCGAGESQIVAPDGTVVARGPRIGEAVVVADIDLDQAGLLRPDGTDVLAARRPQVYAALARPTPEAHDHPRATEILVAAAQDLDQVRQAVAAGAVLVVLPELADVEASELQAILRGSDALIVISKRIGDAHTGLVISATGIVHRQRQVHRVGRHPWAIDLGDSVGVLDLPWGRLAVIVGDDHIYPEIARLAALQSVDVLAVPFAAQEPWETRTGLVERAAENRLCLIAATAHGAAGESVIVSLPPDFTLWAPSRERVFDGTINQPDVLRAVSAAEVLIGVVHPQRSTNRQISRNTDLVNGRPWKLCAALTAQVHPQGPYRVSA